MNYPFNDMPSLDRASLKEAFVKRFARQKWKKEEIWQFLFCQFIAPNSKNHTEDSFYSNVQIRKLFFLNR